MVRLHFGYSCETPRRVSRIVVDVSSRIVDRLIACSVPCVVFAAPAGFGKTHMAMAYAALFPSMAIVTAVRDMSAMDVVSVLCGLPDGRGGPIDSLESASKNIWNVPEGICIVIDSAECLDDPTLLEVLTSLERFRPPNGTLLVCVRREPSDFSFSDVFAPHLLVVFRRADLELTFDELRASVPKGETLSVTALYHIYNLTLGWPVPALSLLRAGAAETFDTAGWHLEHPALKDLFDWLDANVVKTLGQDVVDVLLRCVACCDVVPADFDAAFENAPSRADRRLYRSSQCADIGYSGEIQVHPLIALAVRARYAGDVDRRAYEAASLFIEQGERIRASRAMIAIGNLERAAAILDEAGFDAARDLGGFHYPGLLLEHYSRTKPAYVRYPLLWLNLVPCRYYAVGPKALSREGADVLKLHDAKLSGPLRELIVATTAVLLDEIGDVQGAESLAESLRHSGSEPESEGVDLVEMYIDVSHGRFRSALQRWRRLSATFQASPVWYGLHLRCAARAELRLGDLDAGEDALRTLSSLLRIGGCPSLAAFGDMEAALVSWHRGDAGGFLAFRTEFALLAKAYDVPAMWTFLGALFGDDLDAGKPAELCDALAALILAADSRDDRAPEFARRALLSADATGDVAIRIWARVVAAFHDPRNAQGLLAEAGVLAQSTDSAALKELVVARSEANPLLDWYVAAFLQRLPKRLADAAPQPMLSTSELSVCVATGELLRAGQRVKVSEGTLQLLLFLAVRGPANRSAIVDHLWPELDGDAGSNALKICVHRARAQLGDSSSIFVQRSTYALGKHVESSYARMQHLVAVAARPLTDDAAEEVSSTFDQLTRGLVAGSAPWEWFRPIARSLFDAMNALGTRLAQYELERNNPQMALQIARRMISVDSLEEGPRALAMQAYIKMGNPAAAAAEFREFSFLLNRDTGTEPSEQLKRLLNGA
jgi:DNA-binding SARP family transcriptional activator